MLAAAALVFAGGVAIGAFVSDRLDRTPKTVVSELAVPPVTEPRPAPAAPVALEPIPQELPTLGPSPTEALEESEPDVVAPRKPVEQPQWLRNAVAAPEADGRPLIAIVIDDLGLSGEKVRRTAALPAPLTLAFLPYANGLSELTAVARARGHELLVHVPMEPGSRTTDPGPNALLTEYGVRDLLSRIEWNLGRLDGYVGINNHMGSRFTADPSGMAVVLSELNRRGLMFLDSRTSAKTVGDKLARTIGLPSVERDVFLDPDGARSDVAGQLVELERTARRQGYAVGIGHHYNVTLDTLEGWLDTLEERGFVLAPISAIAKLRIAREERALAAIRPNAVDLGVASRP